MIPIVGKPLAVRGGVNYKTSKTSVLSIHLRRLDGTIRERQISRARLARVALAQAGTRSQFILGFLPYHGAVERKSLITAPTQLPPKLSTHGLLCQMVRTQFAYKIHLVPTPMWLSSAIQGLQC
jgi:hypothetical protein